MAVLILVLLKHVRTITEDMHNGDIPLGSARYWTTDIFGRTSVADTLETEVFDLERHVGNRPRSVITLSRL